MGVTLYNQGVTIHTIKGNVYILHDILKSLRWYSSMYKLIKYVVVDSIPTVTCIQQNHRGTLSALQTRIICFSKSVDVYNVVRS